MEFDPTHDFRQALVQAQNEKAKVELFLRSGQSLSGSVGAVADHYLHLTHLTGKEFYDALIRIEDIAAVAVRVRNK
ncbi:MAG: hypothetical protein HYZ53_03470 [Planctomycetes bacterium]|nr:hypothetical protein [Planctomycetota bacterium]